MSRLPAKRTERQALQKSDTADTRPQSQAEQAFVRALTHDDNTAIERQGARVVKFLHELNLDAGTYARMLQAQGAKSAQETAFDFVEQHLEQLQPRDPMERMLAIQLLWQHVRISTLCIRESITKDPREAAALRSSIEQAMNTFRRQAQAMRDLQAPRSLNRIAGGQVNIGDGQIVTNNQLNATVLCANELGCSDVATTAIPTDPRRKSGASGLSSPRKAMDTLNGSKDRRRKTRIKSELTEARPSFRRSETSRA